MALTKLRNDKDFEKEEFSTNEFCSALIASLAAQKKHRLPIGKPAVERAFRNIVDQLHKIAVDSYKSGNENLAFEILEVLDGLRPNPNTGAFDEFWASLRRQQPGRVGISNPRYKYMEIRLSEAHAKSDLETLPDRWRGLIKKSADFLIKAV